MSEEKRIATTEEVKEEARKLTEKELEKVSGGAAITGDVYEQIVERKETAASLLDAKAPAFKAQKASKHGVK